MIADLFIAYTIRASACRPGHKDNHAGLMTPTQMEKWRTTRNRPATNGTSSRLVEDASELEAFLGEVPFQRRRPRV